MPGTPDQISQQILAQLALTMPTLSCAIGTPERKIIDACAEQIAAASIDTYLLGSLLDVDTKAGMELEQFVGLFGYGRLQGTYAQGTVRVTLTVASTTDYTIQQGTTFYTTAGLAGASVQLYYAANQSVVLPAGDYSVDVPVTCTTVGVSGNVPPGAVTNLSTAIGSSAVTNLQAMTDGTDPETDDALRQRFKDTFLRNVAGTADWYIALCQQNTSVTRVIVFGPTVLYTTQIAAPSTTVALPVDQDVKYVWCLIPETRVLTDGLDWVPVGSLRVGDLIVGFDESVEGRGNKRKWRQSRVTQSYICPARTLMVTMDNGTTVTSTADHMWLVSGRRVGHTGKRRGVIRNTQNVQWVKSKDLLPGDQIRYVPSWDEDLSFEAGWMAGITDGEASYNKHNVTILQNPGPVFDKIVDLLARNKFKHSVARTRSTGLSPDPCCQEILLHGGMDERLRFFGIFKSARLAPKFMSDLYGSCIVGKNSNFAKVISVEEAGVQDVVALSTSTNTLVAEGLLSHNTGMTSCFINLGQEDETFYTEGDDYMLSTGVSPVFTRVATGVINQDDIVDLEFQYTPTCSRNDPVNGITNKVDIFCDGIAPYSVTEQTIISGVTLSSLVDDPLYTGNFIRMGSPGNPTATNRYTRLGNVPLVTFPPTLTVGPEIYIMGTHYYVLADRTELQGSRLEASGIEWDSTGPTTGTELTLEYVYNQVPEVLDSVMTSSKQLCTDVLVHQADYVYLQPCLSIEYNRSYSPAVVNAALATRLQSFVAACPFGAQIKFTMLCTVVTQILGVDDVKITTTTDNPDVHGVRVFANSEDPDPIAVYDDDFKLNDNQVAYYLGAIITRVASP